MHVGSWDHGLNPLKSWTNYFLSWYCVAEMEKPAEPQPQQSRGTHWEQSISGKGRPNAAAIFSAILSPPELLAFSRTGPFPTLSTILLYPPPSSLTSRPSYWFWNRYLIPVESKRRSGCFCFLVFVLFLSCFKTLEGNGWWLRTGWYDHGLSSHVKTWQWQPCFLYHRVKSSIINKVRILGRSQNQKPPVMFPIFYPVPFQPFLWCGCLYFCLPMNNPQT